MKNSFTISIMLVLAVSNLLSFSGKGKGWESDPYQITNVQQLQEMNDDPYSHYKLVHDIDASETRTWNVGDHDGSSYTDDVPMGFIPIGTGTQNGFQRSLDGNYFAIRNLYINRPNTDYVGLCTKLSTDRICIKNLGLEDCEITGDDYVGGIAGESTASTVEISYVTGIINGQYFIGGIVGMNTGTILNSYSRAIIKGVRSSGGLVGVNTLNILNCYSVGLISGGSDYSLGKGGLVGKYSSNSSGNAVNCFWDKEKSGAEFSYGGGEIGLSTQKMKSRSTFIDVEWDMTDIWAVESNQNSGYPCLRKKYTSVDENKVQGDVVFSLYPNPVRDFVKISIKDADLRISKIQIVDLFGRMIKEKELVFGDSEIMIRVADVAAGYYMLRVIESENISSRPLIIE